MEGDSTSRRLAAILCADVQGYSRMMGADEQATLRALKASHEVMRRLVAEHRGRVVNAPGDSVLAEFPSVVDAVSCAAAIQAELARRNADAPPEGRMLFRIGVNLGDVLVQGEEIYGDGVNVAARLEALAEGGGICISGSAHEQVIGKVKLAFEDLGEKSVKNIARPVRVYRVLGEGAPARPAPAAAAPALPAIAVLPFANMSGEAEQEYFSDGISEDIITDLSKLAGLLVIARNSTFTYKGRAVDVREVGKQLGVTHVLEGSVRRAGGRVRITAQLLEAASGHHVWAERYDRDFADVFAIQDDITREIVAALDVKLVRGEQASSWRRSLPDPQALDAWYRGVDALNRLQREANEEAARAFASVIRAAPGSPLGHLGMAWTQLSAYRYGWSASPAKTLEEAAALAREALRLDDTCADAHALLGFYHLLSGRNDEAIASGERAVAFNPNHADNIANLGCSYAVSGRPGEAIPLMRRAMRLSPMYPAWYLNILAFAAYAVGDCEQAESAARQGLQRDPAYADCRAIAAAACHALGRSDEARREAAELVRRDPAFKLSTLEGRLAIVKDRPLVERLLGVCRELGLQ